MTDAISQTNVWDHQEPAAAMAEDTEEHTLHMEPRECTDVRRE